MGNHLETLQRWTDGTLWYYRALSDEFRRRKPNRMTRELAIALQELEKAVVMKPRRAPRKGGRAVLRDERGESCPND